MVTMFDCLVKDSKDAISPGKEARAGQVGRHRVMSNECAVYLQMFNEQFQFFQHLFLGKRPELSPIRFFQLRCSCPHSVIR